jgi:hypothetical protein
MNIDEYRGLKGYREIENGNHPITGSLQGAERDCPGDYLWKLSRNVCHGVCRQWKNNHDTSYRSGILSTRRIPTKQDLVADL